MEKGPLTPCVLKGQEIPSKYQQNFEFSPIWNRNYMALPEITIVTTARPPAPPLKKTPNIMYAMHMLVPKFTFSHMIEKSI